MLKPVLDPLGVCECTVCPPVSRNIYAVFFAVRRRRRGQINEYHIALIGVPYRIRTGVAAVREFRVADFDHSAGTITVRASKGGRARHVILTEDGIALFSAHAAGKPGSALVFAKADGTAWGRSHQHRPLRDACAAAKIEPAVSFHVLRHSYATMLLRGGAPLPVIAANPGHSDTRMTERHYAHLVLGYVAETIRASMPKLGIVERSNVTTLDLPS